MVNTKFYLDKADKNRNAPIHLVIRQKDLQVKVAVGVKIKCKDWDNKNQMVKESSINHQAINKYLTFLKSEVDKHLETAPHNQLTDIKLKEKISTLVKTRKSNTEIKIVHDDNKFYEDKTPVTFVDLFAGAGGFSEGFLQAYTKEKYYDFLLASDINENCELTHRARYNYQLGLDAEFLKQDITEPDFLDNLVEKLHGREVAVICGGPPCQSFSLAGRRKKYDKKDDLFAHYLQVIRHLRPKYFIMENVKGILTKEQGKIREMILQEIKSIVDLQEFHQLIDFVDSIPKTNVNQPFILKCYKLRLLFETLSEKELDEGKANYIQNVEKKFMSLITKIADYKTSKTDPNINTIRHGFNLLKREIELLSIRKKIINEKSHCNIDNDSFVQDFDAFLTVIDSESIIGKIRDAFHTFHAPHKYAKEIDEIIFALQILTFNLDECIQGLDAYAENLGRSDEFKNILSHIRLYNIDEPFVALASNYGVPQNRERVLFIGCRKDQKLITKIPPTVKTNEKVTVYEALYDLNFLGNDDEKFNYEILDAGQDEFDHLIMRRTIDGKPDRVHGITYSDWSKQGRINGRFKNAKNPIYVRTLEELDHPANHLVAPLHNHKTSKQNASVINRLGIILQAGDYDMAKSRLEAAGLDSDKRNYNVLKADSQSPTIMTMPDDYIHYASPRALTVREMARLQSFDDSFVFQGKRSTGGGKRKTEVPQFTLVGNAVPPLLARAIALEVLKNIT
jgi:DNA (cytosine-5)-methyltransferase 1